MIISKSIKTIRNLIKKERAKGKSIGFVPTMGALHEGHLSLIRKCRKDNDIVVLSIYVNPAQFGPNEDFGKYPRPKKNDVLLAKREKVDIIFYPSDDEMYKQSYLTYINVEEITTFLCGKSRPTHFRGVTTVVGKLFNIIAPDVAYFGQKDAQQAVVIKQMARDLNFPVKIKILPIVREQDGLALSSRNKFLTADQRREATILYSSLSLAREKIKTGQRSTQAIKNFMRREISDNTSGKIDYIECVDYKSLRTQKILKGQVLIALAVKFGSTRLIDNIIVEIK